MKLTKRFTAMVMCGVMAASMAGMSVSAVNVNYNSNISFENETAVTPYILSKHTISGLGTVFGQDDTNICWAACVQEVLEYYGVTESQENIVKERGPNGEYHNKGANYTEIKNVLNSFSEKNKLDKTFTSFTDSVANYDKVMSKVNLDKPPIMIGKLNGTAHALLCYGYDKSNSNNITLSVISPTTSGGRKLTLKCDPNDKKTFTSADGDKYVMSAIVAEY